MAYKPPEGGGASGGPGLLSGKTSPLTIYGVVYVAGSGFMVWRVRYFVSPFGAFLFVSFSLFALETFETRNAQYPKNGFVIEMLLFLIFRRKMRD